MKTASVLLALLLNLAMCCHCLSQASFDVHIADVSTNKEPPLISAVLNGQKVLVESLLAEKADVNVRNKNGWTPLHCAALKNRTDLAELLIAHGAEIDATNNPGATPLDVAAVNGNTDVARLLIARKADVQGKDARTGWTPLHGAAFHGHTDAAKLLLANGADINAKDNDGMTPLYWAVVGHHQDVVELLLANHADVNAKDKDGNTPVRYAVLHDEEDMADLLRQHDNTHENVFEPIVSAIADEPLEGQYKFILRLSKGLTPESIARHGRRLNIPNFGDLARELMAQKKYDLMRTILIRREIDPGAYLSIARLLAKNLDAATFQILLTNSNPTTPDAPNDSWGKGTNYISSDGGFPEVSCSLLGFYYLHSDAFHNKTEAHLILVLKHHPRSGARAEAAHRLGDCDSPEAVKALEETINDKAMFSNSNGPYDYVYQWAEDSLQKIKARKEGGR